MVILNGGKVSNKMRNNKTEEKETETCCESHQSRTYREKPLLNITESANRVSVMYNHYNMLLKFAITFKLANFLKTTCSNSV